MPAGEGPHHRGHPRAGQGRANRLPQAVTSVWPQTLVQTCIVHLTHASLRWVKYKDRKKVAAQLRLIYGAPSEQAARDALDAWTDSEMGRQYPAIKQQ